MTRIAIVGAGIAGTHLGLLLQHHGVDAVVYTERSADAQRHGPLRSVPTHFASTRAQERMLGIDAWSEATETVAIHVEVLAGPRPFGFRGRLEGPALCIDHRLHLPLLMDELEARGGRIEIGPMRAADLPDLARGHDLVVVCTGRGGIEELFPRVAERSPYEQPQRRITSGIYHGVRSAEPPGMSIHITEHGEVFSSPFHTVLGSCAMIGFEGIPGGAFEHLSRLRYQEDPRAFDQAVLACVRAHVPGLLELIDEQEFALTRPEDLLQGGLTPVVRRGYARLDASTFALALGDAHIVNDPITGQGANLAAHAAGVLAATIVEAARAGAPMDEVFCRQVERGIWAQSGPASMWSNQMLGPPAPQLLRLLAAAGADPRVADAFARNFEYPAEQWRALSSPESTARFLEQFAAGARTGAAQDRVRAIA